MPTHLRELLRRDGILVIPAVYDALSAKIAERLGFKAVGLGGFLVAASRLGLPDVGYLTMSEMVEAVRAMAGAVGIPLLADGDTGYGNPLNVRRTVQEYEAAGAQGIVLEDQVWPKKCGHIPGPRQVVSLDEHLKKLEAALEARRDARTLIIARTDARGPLGFDEAIRRARAYQKLGVDGVFIEALQSLEEVRRAPAELPGVALVANMFVAGKTPLCTSKELEGFGYKIALWVTDALWAAAKAVKEVLETLRDEGTTVRVRDRLMGFDEYFDLVGLPEHQRLESRYAP
ncbi:MAG: oxaloacetate decarboxylase [Candidatus Rokubacteria bacterium]|nr:oxaloacetate decarboxylase [Candidatus Rokubacteria bacterium]MBI2554251.1 oxaloacetate decarboxylase [Candidatus Rokubacteria bacterium]